MILFSSKNSLHLELLTDHSPLVWSFSAVYNILVWAAPLRKQILPFKINFCLFFWGAVLENSWNRQFWSATLSKTMLTPAFRARKRGLNTNAERHEPAPHRGLAPTMLIFQTSPSCNIFSKIPKFFKIGASPRTKGWFLAVYRSKLPWFGRNPCQPSHKGLALNIN